MQKICPAYQSAFILDEYEQREAYSLFTEVDGTVVPKKPYGFKFKVTRGDTLMEKFLAGTKGKGFRVQVGRVHPYQKFGFTYDNWKKENLLSRIFRGRDKPVLENPYLFDKLVKKKPFYQLDGQDMDIVHFNSARYERIVADIIDTARYKQLMAEYDSLPPPVQVQRAPLLRGGFNVEQEEYNRKFGGYFLRMKPQPKLAPVDSMKLQQLADSLAADTIQKKKGIFGIFKKKKSGDLPQEDTNTNKGTNDSATSEEEED